MTDIFAFMNKPYIRQYFSRDQLFVLSLLRPIRCRVLKKSQFGSSIIKVIRLRMMERKSLSIISSWAISWTALFTIRAGQKHLMPGAAYRKTPRPRYTNGVMAVKHRDAAPIERTFRNTGNFGWFITNTLKVGNHFASRDKSFAAGWRFIKSTGCTYHRVQPLNRFTSRSDLDDDFSLFSIACTKTGHRIMEMAFYQTPINKTLERIVSRSLSYCFEECSPVTGFSWILVIAIKYN